MSDIVLSDGTEITFDLNKVNRFEVRALLDEKQSDEEANKILAKTCELTEQQINDLGYDDWRRFVAKFWERATRPLSDPHASRSDPI